MAPWPFPLQEPGTASGADARAPKAPERPARQPAGRGGRRHLRRQRSRDRAVLSSEAGRAIHRPAARRLSSPSHTPAGTLKEGSLEEVIGVDVVAVGIHVVAVDIDVVLVGVNARQVQTHARRDPLLQLLDLELENHYSPPFV